MNSETIVVPRWRARVEGLSASPRRAIASLISAHVIFLALLPFAVSSAPSFDVVESLIWGQEWLVGTHKLPPGPAWLIEISYHLTGSPILGPYLVSQLFVALTYVLVFAAARRLTSTNNALAGTLLLAGVVYFTWPSTEFNHNVIQMPVWAAALLLFTIIREDARRPGPWLLLGVVAGLGIYAKYSVIVFYAVLVAWAFVEDRIRRALLTPWPWLGVAVSLAVAAPHIKWMVDTNFEQIDFVRARTQHAGSIPPGIEWMLIQIAFHLPVGLLLAMAGRRAIALLPRHDTARRDIAYVAYMAAAPALAIVLLALVTGRRPETMWGIPLFGFSGLLVVMLLRREWNDALVRRLWAASVGLVAVVGIAFTATIVASRALGDPVRAAWPMAEIAAKAHAAWASRTSEPLRIVSGQNWLAGLVSTGSPERPHVVYEGVLAISPWLDEERLREDGVLYVWFGQEPPGFLVPADAPIEARGTFEVAGVPDRYRIVGYAVRLPQ